MARDPRLLGGELGLMPATSYALSSIWVPSTTNPEHRVRSAAPTTPTAGFHARRLRRQLDLTVGPVRSNLRNRRPTHKPNALHRLEQLGEQADDAGARRRAAQHQLLSGPARGFGTTLACRDRASERVEQAPAALADRHLSIPAATPADGQVGAGAWRRTSRP